MLSTHPYCIFLPLVKDVILFWDQSDLRLRTGSKNATHFQIVDPQSINSLKSIMELEREWPDTVSPGFPKH